ncbi:MAG: nucleotidyltransferase family protein [Candidatus Gastranaerophilaceae bacterium]
MNIVISENERKIVKDVLSNVLADDVKVYVFGSRVKGTLKEYADLDLALQGRELLPQSILDTLNIKFEESLLPYKVDVIDLNNIDTDFYNTIKQDLTPFLYD